MGNCKEYVGLVRHLLTVLFLLIFVIFTADSKPRPFDYSAIEQSVEIKVDTRAKRETSVFREVRVFKVENNSNGENDEPEPPFAFTAITTEIPSTTTFYYYDPWNQWNTNRIIILVLISVIIPILFMGMVFWRLRKERKYLNSQNGSLLYRETIIVPRYTTSSNSNPESGENTFNVSQMYSTLYDSPPDYEAVSKKPLENCKQQLEMRNNPSSREESPPPYSSIHF